MKWIFAAIVVYSAYYTWMYSKSVWKDNKLASIFIFLLAFSILLIPLLRKVLPF